MLKLTIKEELIGTGSINELPIQLSSERITLAELIQKKVMAKVKQVNQELKQGKFNSPFLSEKEKILNQDAYQKRLVEEQKKIERAMLDPEKAAYDALAGFQQNAFFVIIDGQQKEALTEELVLSDRSEVQFIRLTPLVGG
ncbi:MAG: hypothetical protein AAF985_22725 [Bacteroidota bacterium]